MINLETLLTFWRKNWIACAILAMTFVAQVITLRPIMVLGEPYMIASNMVKGLGYSYPQMGHTDPSITCYIPPLYVWICYAFLKTGIGPVGIQVFNLLCLNWAAFVVLRLSRQFLNETLALVSFAAFCAYLPFWILASSIDPNTLNILLLTLTVDCLYWIVTRPSRKSWVTLGLLTGIQLLVRPDMLLGAVFFGVWLIILLRKRMPLPKILANLLLVGGIALLCVIPWTIRNAAVFHRFVLVSANSGFNLWMGNNARATGEFSLLPPDASEVAQSKQVEAYVTSHAQVDYDAYYRDMAIAWALHHPGDLFLLDLKKIYYHWWVHDKIGQGVRVDNLRNEYAILSFFLLVFGFYGLHALKNRTLRSLIFTVFLYSTAVSAIFFVQTRHRVLKADPFLIPLTVAGAYALKEKILPNKRYLDAQLQNA